MFKSTTIMTSLVDRRVLPVIRIRFGSGFVAGQLQSLVTCMLIYPTETFFLQFVSRIDVSPCIASDSFGVSMVDYTKQAHVCEYA